MYGGCSVLLHGVLLHENLAVGWGAGDGSQICSVHMSCKVPESQPELKAFTT